MTTSPVAVDFETFYSDDCSVQKGTGTYLRHPQFDAYLVSMHGEGINYCGSPKDAPWDKLEDKTIICHNLSFDGAILRKLSSEGKIPCWVAYNQAFCSSDLAAYSGFPRSLKESAKAALGMEMSKDVRNRMKGIVWELLAPEKKAQVVEYAATDAKATFDLWSKLSGAWPEQERELSRHTREMGWGGVGIDEEGCEKGMTALLEHIEHAKSQIPWGEPYLSHHNLKKWCKEQNIEPPSSTAEDDESAEAWLAENADKAPAIAGMRKLRQANRLFKVLETMLERSHEGRMDYGLKYFGAGITGRWSGDTGWNAQNLPRNELFGINARGLVVPAPGKKFIISDLAQIEPRCAAVIVRDNELLDLVRSGVSLYEAYARAALSWSGGPLKKEDPDLYKVVKATVLSLGYGVGWKKFQQTLGQMGVYKSEPECRSLVAEYRGRNSGITSLWRRLEGEFKDNLGQNNEIVLPSGRKMVYRNCLLDDERQLTCVVPKNGKMMRVPFYGAKLFENVIQATAREVMAGVILRLNNAGVRVVMTIHDEVVCEVDKSADPREVSEIIEKSPDWMPDLPVECGTRESMSYAEE